MALSIAAFNCFAFNRFNSSAVSFFLNADPVFDLFITELRVHGIANGVKFGKFLNLNQKLSTGIVWDIHSDELDVELDPIKSTDDIKAKFASLGGWNLDVQAGGDHVLGILDFDVTPIVIRKQGTFVSDDKIEAIVNDDLRQVSELFVTAIGFKRE